METSNFQKGIIGVTVALAIKKRTKRKKWVKDWLMKREQYTHLNLLNEIKCMAETEDYENYYRMKEACFDELLEMVKPYLTKQDTCMRKSISAEEKLSATLRYLATGRNFEDLKFSVIMSPAAISEAILYTCEVLTYVLQSYIKVPSTEDEWKNIGSEFGERYQFWNCLGAVDGKHVAIQKPAHSGSFYYNYKGFFSIVLMALANSNKEFIMVDAGTNGAVSDGGVLFYTEFWNLFQNGMLNIPKPSPLPYTDEEFPHVIISDEAFALNINLMKPYPQGACIMNKPRKTFNYRLSRARSVVEGAFGLLRTKFGVFQKAICLEPKKSTTVVLATCYLHNYLLKTQRRSYLASNWKIKRAEHDEQFVPLQSRSTPRKALTAAQRVREQFCDYFSNEGKLYINYENE